MANFKFDLNTAGVGELLKSPEMQGVLNGYGSSALSRLGDGYEAETFVGFDRAHVIIKATTAEAKRENLENNSLLKAVK